MNIAKDFPILRRKINGRPLVYLDNAATSQKPIAVIEAIKRYYYENNANVHRAVHTLSGEATEQYELARRKIAEFINAESSEIIFVKNATEGINLIAKTFGKLEVCKDDTVLITSMEHHSNILPWRTLAEEKGASIKVAPILTDGTLDMNELHKLLDKKPKILAITHISNVLGTINPVKDITAYAHKQGVAVIIDGAQSTAHTPIDVKDIDADFFVFTGHKILGPTGIGVVYGKKEILKKMPPFMTGGEMIKEVGKNSVSWNDVPWKFEAGTPNICGAIGLSAAVDYINNLGMKNIRRHIDKLTSYAVQKLSEIKNVTIYGPHCPDGEIKSAGIISFNIEGVHPHDAASILNQYGVAIRSGYHCAEPLARALNIEGSCRASFSAYNTFQDIDIFVEAIKRVKQVLL